MSPVDPINEIDDKEIKEVRDFPFDKCPEEDCDADFSVYSVSVITRYQSTIRVQGDCNSEDRHVTVIEFNERKD